MSVAGQDFQESDSGEGEATWPPADGERRKRRYRRSSDQVLHQAEMFVASIEAIGDGVMLLDSSGTLVFVSDSTSAILAGQSDYLYVEGDRLRFPDAMLGSRFEALLELVEEEKLPATQGKVLVIERQPPRPPILLSIMPLPRPQPDDASVARSMVVLRDLARVPVPQWQVFAQHFKLSGAETRLCLALADGVSLAEYSTNFHLSLHTARTHLKSVFVKTQTRRQADLLRLIFAFTRL